MWPSLERARGTTFVGIFEGSSRDPDWGRTHHWNVERVYAGPLRTGPLDGWGIGVGCHPTAYRKGERYLVSSQFAGGATAFDTVAYRLLGDGRVRIASYPGQPGSTAPRAYQVDTLSEAIKVLVPPGVERLPPSAAGPFQKSTSGSARSDLFGLSISTDRARVTAGEPIRIDTRLRYRGTAKNKPATVTGPAGLVAFEIRQVDGPIDTGPGWPANCWHHRFAPGEVQDVPFRKSGGWDRDGRRAGFWEDWFDDPVLRLPEGRYVITAHLHHGARGARCTGPYDTLSASVSIKVVPSPDGGATRSAPATAGAVAPIGSAAVPIVGPDGLGPAPTAPSGPAWRSALQHEFLTGAVDAVACGGGATVMAYGHDDELRPQAHVWVSPDGVEWTAGAGLAPEGNPEPDAWTAFDLVVFREDLYALGGDGKRLAVWRSPDCGRTWQRLEDRPRFFLGHEAHEHGLNSIMSAATDETMLVVGRQAGERIQERQWAWTMDPEGRWQRVPSALYGIADWGLASGASGFSAMARSGKRGVHGVLATSSDGWAWVEQSSFPRFARVTADDARSRFLLQAHEPPGQPDHVLEVSRDGREWVELARTASLPSGSNAELLVDEGVLVWIVDVFDESADDFAWSWIAVSEDGGSSWDVSTGWFETGYPAARGLAVTDDAIVLATIGREDDDARAWVRLRDATEATQ